MKKILIIISIFALFANACTDGFEDANVNPYEITDESLTQDFNNLGSFYPTLLYNLFGHQVEENLSAESYCNYMAQPTVFLSGVNNTTYYPTWYGGYWDRIYDNVMSPASQVISIAEAADGDYSVFIAWAKLIKILGMSRLTTYHGPVIYTTYGEEDASYDSEEDLYNAFFDDLDEIQAVFAANEDYVGITNFDASYEGDITKWEKLVNSMRLRLAIRISKVAPDLAQTQGEKAISDAAGLITSNDDNFNVSLYGNDLYLSIICFSWNDTRMSAAMESFLVGLKDPRIASYFEPATDENLYADHTDYPYKGIRCGAKLVAKSDHTPCSTINASFETVEERPYLTASEVYFDLAEAALRGWSNAGDAGDNYEAGVTASLSQWGASGVADYLTDSVSTPIDYDDLAVSGTVNDFTSRSTITIAWKDTDSDELKLEKIITQKWIASFTNPNEPWADFRRTGYPKLPHVYQNSSTSDFGVIGDDEWIKRLPFPSGERSSNADAVAAAVATMKGDDLISTRLWWDTGESNF